MMHDPLCACTLREHFCQDHWAGTLCTKCECRKIARVRADQNERIAASLWRLAESPADMSRFGWHAGVRDAAEHVAVTILRGEA